MEGNQEGQKLILVTGGLGYIGSHTVIELVNAGFKALIIDNLSNSQRKCEDRVKQIIGKEREDWIKVIELDLNFKDQVLKLFQENKIDGVIHFAAFKAVGESVKYPLKYY